ncbi:MAG: TusE/DsrC/DsvC family sulfur relay protein [Cephaloticoccus sp.]|nr:TusE/DsrC/DsvC family sulfur relay protein [Cephaloticoccus sp.]MCF7761122.1 TusE/DsrC/DsvC family sulfur relay protein [Cephaloticoccus sp.]
MPIRTINNKTVDFDDEGFMTNYKDWDLAIAKVIATEEGIPELNDRHVVVLEFMRKEFEIKGDGPSIRKLTKESGVPTKELYELFPSGPAKKAAKIAGIKKPHGCI